VKTYSIFLERADDGSWSGLVPALPGLLLAADTQEELVRTAPDAILDYLDAMREDNLPLPNHPEVALVEVLVPT